MKKVLIIAFAALVGLTACKGRRQAQQVLEQAAQQVKEQVQKTLPENPPAGTIETRFQGTDSITRKMHIVDVSFYPELSKAVVRMGEKVYDLAEYPTADGYGYRNAELDLRGKGNEAWLTFTDPKMRGLTLTAVKEGQ